MIWGPGRPVGRLCLATRLCIDVTDDIGALVAPLVGSAQPQDPSPGAGRPVGRLMSLALPDHKDVDNFNFEVHDDVGPAAPLAGFA